MDLRTLRFSSIMSTAVSMSAALGHLMEMPAKMRYKPRLYVNLHRTLYPNFGRIAGVAEILAVVTTAGLAWRLRKRRSNTYPLAVTAAASMATAHGAFWLVVSPANTTMGSWPLDSIPPDWSRWRNQWEYAHATRALLVTSALGSLVWSVLRDTSGRVGLLEAHPREAKESKRPAMPRSQ